MNFVKNGENLKKMKSRGQLCKVPGDKDMGKVKVSLVKFEKIKKKINRIKVKFIKFGKSLKKLRE